MSLLIYPKIIPYTKFEHFEVILFELGYAVDQQTNKQTDGLERTTHADRQLVGVGSLIIRPDRLMNSCRQAHAGNCSGTALAV